MSNEVRLIELHQRNDQIERRLARIDRDALRLNFPNETAEKSQLQSELNRVIAEIELLDRLRRLSEMAEWQPIESAPSATVNDPIIVAEIKDYGIVRCALVRKSKGGLFTVYGGDQCKHWATHWMRPPEPPKFAVDEVRMGGSNV